MEGFNAPLLLYLYCFPQGVKAKRESKRKVHDTGSSVGGREERRGGGEHALRGGVDGRGPRLDAAAQRGKLRGIELARLHPRQRRRPVNLRAVAVRTV